MKRAFAAVLVVLSIDWSVSAKDRQGNFVSFNVPGCAEYDDAYARTAFFGGKFSEPNSI